jgi:hypothetical protein
VANEGVRFRIPPIPDIEVSIEGKISEFCRRGDTFQVPEVVSVFFPE